MTTIFKLLKNTVFVGILLFSLVSFAISATIFAVTQAQKAAQASAALASQAVKHQRALSRERAKARLRRAAVAVPVFGAGAALYFEEKDRREWLELNPGKSSVDYACHISEVSTEIVDEVLKGSPVRTGLPQWAIPECDNVEN